MYSILVAFGTRPEAIKMAPLIRALREPERRLEVRVAVTGEQGRTVDQAVELFEIGVDAHLALGEKALDRAGLLAAAIEGLSALMAEDRPDLVLVLGDTVTTLAASMAAYYQRIPVAHVEAGLRAEGKFSTFPEEGHRLMITHIADLHFAPTETSRTHQLGEGIDPDEIFVTGNTVIDALLWVRARLDAIRASRSLMLPELFTRNATARRLPVKVLKAIRRVESGDARLVLITGSRPEVFDGGLQSICGAVSRLADMYPQDVFIYPADLPERMQSAVQGLLADRDNIFVLPPLDYLPFVFLMMHSHFVLTDSGSIQEEAPGLGKPVLLMRRTTDRPEALEAGAVQLVGTDAVSIVTAARRLLDDDVQYRRMSEKSNLYGDGNAARRIADLIETHAFQSMPHEAAS